MLFICPIRVGPSLLGTPCLYKFILLFSRNSFPARLPPSSEPFLLPFLHARHGLHMVLMAEPLGGEATRQLATVTALWAHPFLQKLWCTISVPDYVASVSYHHIQCELLQVWFISGFRFTNSSLFSSFSSVPYRNLVLVFVSKTASLQIAFFVP